MDEPPNFRKINDPKLLLVPHDNPNDNCGNCHFFNDDKCEKYDMWHHTFSSNDEFEYMEHRDVTKLACDSFLAKKKHNPERIKYVFNYLILFAIIASCCALPIALLLMINIPNPFVWALLVVFTLLPIILVIALYFYALKKVKVRINNFIEDTKKSLEGTFNIPFSQVYETFQITKQELIDILSGISNKLYDISDTEILVYNKYRMQFLEAINEEYGKYIDKNRVAIYTKKLADLGRLQNKEGSELMQEKSPYKKVQANKMVICDRCGEEVQSSSKTCPSCGNRVKK